MRDRLRMSSKKLRPPARRCILRRASSTFADQETALRYVIIGCAARIAERHFDALSALSAEVVGVSDTDATKGEAIARHRACPFYVSHTEMLRELRPDISVLCSPASYHARQTQDCLAHGSHVLVEKPMATEVADADAIIEAASAAGRVVAVNFQERFRPTIEAAHSFVRRGELGALVRVTAVQPYLRTAVYYRATPWRGAWFGDGGGVLMNQAPHLLDTLCYLVGMPQRVWGVTGTRAHAIPSEDTATAMFEYPGGAMGTFAVSTAEGGGERTLESSVSAGLSTSSERGSRPAASSPRFPRTSRQPARGRPRSPSTRKNQRLGRRVISRCIPISERRFTGDMPPAADASEGRKSLELANAIVLSSHRERPVDLPARSRGVPNAV